MNISCPAIMIWEESSGCIIDMALMLLFESSGSNGSTSENRVLRLACVLRVLTYHSNASTNFIELSADLIFALRHFEYT